MKKLKVKTGIKAGSFIVLRNHNRRVLRIRSA